MTDQNGHQEVSNTYNSEGQVTTQTNALGKKATFSYDASDDTTTYTDPNGNQWQDVYQNGVLVDRIDPTGWGDLVLLRLEPRRAAPSPTPTATPRR